MLLFFFAAVSFIDTAFALANAWVRESDESRGELAHGRLGRFRRRSGAKGGFPYFMRTGAQSAPILFCRRVVHRRGVCIGKRMGSRICRKTSGAGSRTARQIPPSKRSEGRIPVLYANRSTKCSCSFLPPCRSSTLGKRKPRESSFSTTGCITVKKQVIVFIYFICYNNTRIRIQ